MDKTMKTKNVFFVLAICAFCCFASSCIYVIAGGVGALGGYAVSPDTVEGESDTSYDTAWDSATEVLSIMGTVNTKDYKLGNIVATIDGSKVTVDVSQISSEAVRFRVKARKNMLPNIKVAQDVFVKIKKRIKE
jgi:hypothetical protein